MSQFYTSYIEISKSALEHNLSFIKEIVKKNVRISSVVKANAYGHGIEQFIPLAEECGINHFSVFSAEEAYRVFNSGNKNSDIVIMGYLSDDQLEWAIEHKIEFYAFGFDRLEKALKMAQKMNTRAIIHIEIETGMNRTGFMLNELNDVIAFLKKNDRFIEFKGLCTHFAGAESIANYYRIKGQQQLFKKAEKIFNSANMHATYRHCACSAATLRYPNTQMDLVRLGIVLFGFFPTREVLVEFMGKRKIRINPLQRLMSWKTRVMDVKKVKTGEFIGYGTSYLASSDIVIATIPIGYGNGYSRSLSNLGRVLLRGRRVSVLGLINMSMASVDATEIEGIEVGDEVVLIGNQGELEISVSSFSEFSEQINYELLTRLPENIPRIIVD